MNYDIAIIGGGVTGTSIARELSKYKLSVCLIDKNQDIGEGTSKANSGIVHGGFDAHRGSLKARLNVQGAKMMSSLSEELDFPYRNNGSMVIAWKEEELEQLEGLKKQGEINGVESLEIITGNQARVLEPNLSKSVCGALLIKSSGIVCPFNLTIAFAENAAINGVDFYLGHEVKDVKPIRLDKSIEKAFPLENENFRIEMVDKNGEKLSIKSKIVINAAGVFGDIIHNKVLDHVIDYIKSIGRLEDIKEMEKLREKIIPRRGEYCLYDKREGDFVNHTIFQLPTKLGKGVLVTPTVHGNMMVGPNARDLEDKDAKFETGTSREGLAEILEKASKSVEELPPRSTIITSFAGLRAHRAEDDFLIGELKEVPGFIDVIGIESPGLSCAPAIGPFVGEIVKGIIEAFPKESWQGKRQGVRLLEYMSVEERAAVVEKNSAYGNIICRCEGISEGEILDAIHRPLGATTLDGIKRRTRAGSGRCQAGFCMPRVMEILSRELKEPLENICKAGENSKVIEGSLR